MLFSVYVICDGNNCLSAYVIKQYLEGVDY